ncbi:hypothetical protein QBC35DRAFT_483760 [Podospora australis]|uniref:Dynamin N-terminal domain-containing protein n=1 Tax=Podospora australis TaxID=1536484 RepID=A0AAN6X6W4_9PEZI|nr:hypothetical protein QBC35DRAFT_483760 [Podospora australis]
MNPRTTRELGRLPPSRDMWSQTRTRTAPPNTGLVHLQRLVAEGSPAQLDRGVAIGVKVLESLKPPLQDVVQLGTTQAGQWRKSFADLEALAKPVKTIVGVVGNTGAGKSSVISAVLDEERLLPTNCMRACTASPTEISYNHSVDPSERYRAEVEFITHDDWVKDLKALFTGLLDGSGQVSRDCSNEDTEAGVAYAKIKAVYPKKTKEVIAESNPESLAKEPAVRTILGTTRKLKATTAASLYLQLQRYVDSKEKNTDKSREYWPLIKVVRIYTKAAALETGACLVDLPGVQDSNAARAAVAAHYRKACAGLWIVAPINRAVDDKTAKSLLGDSFRRQLKFDGTYSAVTFICSKTDDISATEAAESLEQEKLEESWTILDKIDRDVRDLRKKIAEYEDERDVCDDLLDKIESRCDGWEALGAELAEGETVYEPKTPQKKRKRQSKPRGSRKNRNSADSDESDYSDSDASDDSDKENHDETPEEDRTPLTEDQIDTKLKALRDEKKKIRATKKEVLQKIAKIRSQIKEFTAEKKALNSEIKEVCIKGRNEYSKNAIQRDFAMGIKELDQECAAEEDEENFDPDVDIRDYDAVAKALKVFCVSSRAFQKISGRLQKDNFDESGFNPVDDTEIPQLQAHAKMLTENGRAAASRRFLNSLITLLNSMTMWATNDGTRSTLTDAEQRAEDSRLRARLNKVEQELDAALRDCTTDMQRALYENIYGNFDKCIPVAIDTSAITAQGWGAHRDSGGLLWATYKATCRRSGVFTGSAGPRDFNQELFEPISRRW